MNNALRCLLTAVVIFICADAAIAQQKNKTIVAKEKAHPENKVKQYWFVMLDEGKNRTQDSSTAAKIQEGHMGNIKRLYYMGKLKVAGPFGDDGNWKGIFIFDCKTKEELETLLNTDPAIAAGRLAYDIHPWWTAAIGSFAPGKPAKNP